MKMYFNKISSQPLFVILAGIALSGCGDKAEKNPVPVPHVIVVTAHQAPLDITTELPGRTSAYRVAEVRPQVGGILLKRNFVEGSEIQRGESLYKIDPANYQAALNKAKSELQQTQAAAHISHLTVDRYKNLITSHYVSQQDYDTALATARQADANVASSKALLDSAQIQLNYTNVTSPINGRIGKSSLTEGALVTPEQTHALATVQQLDPIYVDVTQSSNDFSRLKQSVKQGTVEKQSNPDVSLVMENGQVYPQKGRLEFSDVTVDESTGSITLRALFPNPQHDLLPGMYVKARVNEGVQKSAILIPQQGVTRNPRGDATVMLLNAQNKVEVRTVEASQAIGDKWLITQGLSEGDKVIISGLQKVKPGMPVLASETSPQPAA